MNFGLFPGQFARVGNKCWVSRWNCRLGLMPLRDSNIELVYRCHQSVPANQWFPIGARSPPHWPVHGAALFYAIAAGEFVMECAALFPLVKDQHSPWIVWSCTGCLLHRCFGFTCLVRDIVAAYSRPMVGTHVPPRDVVGRRPAFTSLARRGCSRDTPVGSPIVLSRASFSLSLFSMSLTKMPSPLSLLLLALTAPTTTMGPTRCRQRSCRRHRCSSHGGDVTPRCRTSNSDDAYGSLELYLRGQAATNPEVSIFRSRPSDFTDQLSTDVGR